MSLDALGAALASATTEAELLDRAAEALPALFDTELVTLARCPEGWHHFTVTKLDRRGVHTHRAEHALFGTAVGAALDRGAAVTTLDEDPERYEDWRGLGGLGLTGFAMVPIGAGPGRTGTLNLATDDARPLTASDVHLAEAVAQLLDRHLRRVTG